MKKYTKPEINITDLNNETTVLVSAGINFGNGNINSEKGGYTDIYNY